MDESVKMSSATDMILMRSIVGVDVLSPSDEIATRMMARMTITRLGLRVIRLKRHALPPDLFVGDRSWKQGLYRATEGNRYLFIIVRPYTSQGDSGRY